MTQHLYESILEYSNYLVYVNANRFKMRTPRTLDFPYVFAQKSRTRV